MGDSRYSAGLTDDDSLSQFPSAANPLASLGIDPLDARANPELLSALNPGETASTTPTASVRAAGAIGGAGEAPPAETTPTPALATANDYAMAGLSSLKNDADLATQAASAIPTSNPDVERLAAQRKKLATPTPLYDSQTGKMLATTMTADGRTIAPRPTGWQRLGRGLRSAGVGLATGGLRGAILGAIDPAAEPGGTAYGAPNAAYQHAEQERQAELGATDSGLKTAFDNWKQAVDAQKAKGADLRATATLGKDLTTGATDIEKIPIEQEKADNDKAKLPIEKEKADNATPENKARASELEQTAKINARRNDPIAQSLPRGYIRNRYILTGEMQAAHDPTGEERNVASLTAAWRRENPGKSMTTTDLASIYREASGAKESASGGGDDQVGAIVADATAKKQEYADGFTRLKNGDYLNNSTSRTVSGKEFNDKIDAFRTDANKRLAKYGASIDAQGNVVHGGSSAAQNNAKIAPTPPAGATGQAKGSDGKMHWVNANTREVLGPVEGSTQ